MESKINCPYCKIPMQKIKKADVTLDRCPECLGIWLDKGELDKIIVKRKDTYKEQIHKNWGRPHAGVRPPSEDDDVSLLIGEEI